MDYLGDGDRLSGEHRLVDDAAALDEDSVALHDEAAGGRQQDDVTGHQLHRRDLSI